MSGLEYTLNLRHSCRRRCSCRCVRIWRPRRGSRTLSDRTAGTRLPRTPCVRNVSCARTLNEQHKIHSQDWLGFIQTCDLLSVNYSLNNGVYCIKCAHSHLFFGQISLKLKSSIMGCVPFFRNLRGLKCSRIINRSCEWIHSRKKIRSRPVAET